MAVCCAQDDNDDDSNNSKKTSNKTEKRNNFLTFAWQGAGWIYFNRRDWRVRESTECETENSTKTIDNCCFTVQRAKNPNIIDAQL